MGGIIAGSILSKRIPNEKLKPAFGWFVLVMGIYIIGRELSNLAWSRALRHGPSPETTTPP